MRADAGWRGVAAALGAGTIGLGGVPAAQAQTAEEFFHRMETRLKNARMVQAKMRLEIVREQDSFTLSRTMEVDLTVESGGRYVVKMYPVASNKVAAGKRETERDPEVAPVERLNDGNYQYTYLPAEKKYMVEGKSDKPTFLQMVYRILRVESEKCAYTFVPVPLKDDTGISMVRATPERSGARFSQATLFYTIERIGYGLQRIALKGKSEGTQVGGKETGDVITRATLSFQSLKLQSYVRDGLFTFSPPLGTQLSTRSAFDPWEHNFDFLDISNGPRTPR